MEQCPGSTKYLQGTHNYLNVVKGSTHKTDESNIPSGKSILLNKNKRSRNEKGVVKLAHHEILLNPIFSWLFTREGK